jgi:nitroreductase
VSDLFEVMSGQRACRWFLPDDVPDSDIAALLELASHAPSAENAQPWVFVVVRDEGVRAAIAELTQRLWRDGARAHSEPRLAPGLMADVDGAIEAGFGGAPVLVVVAGDVSLVAGGRRALASSLFPAVQNLLLGAIAMGYGSALTTLPAIAPDELRAIVSLPDGIDPVAVVPLGRAQRALGPPRRQPIDGKAHLDHFGTPFRPG